MIKRFSDAEILQMLGLRFKQYRVALGLTQAELSAKAGVSVNPHAQPGGTRGENRCARHSLASGNDEQVPVVPFMTVQIPLQQDMLKAFR